MWGACWAFIAMHQNQGFCHGRADAWACKEVTAGCGYPPTLPRAEGHGG